ncbi:MAG: dihydrofolate reductase family protein, partial [Fimbriimonas ginsengisoli]|nr:dihydrofolate reductase family protein [Fimbriimonas ginsengisoli]
MSLPPDPAAIYAGLELLPPPADRPTVLIDMVATIDGKTVSGGRNEDVLDLGSKLDHQILRRLEGAVDAVILGGATLRAAPKAWQPRPPIRVVVSRSGDFDYAAPFFAGGRALVACSDKDAQGLPPAAAPLAAGKAEFDLGALLARLRHELGVKRLLAVGGSELNGALLGADLADELFLTIAPKVKLGRDTPT